MSDATYKEYRVWDLPTRYFHWINVVCVILMMTLGLIMMYRTELGFASVQAKIALKQLHVSVGYVFILNVLYRVIWGFFGSKHNRWSTLLSFQRGYFRSVKQYLGCLLKREPCQYVGHNPLGRLAVIVIYALLIIMAVTGLVRAGTDVYYPPFGGMAASYVAKPGISPKKLIPYDETQVDSVKFERLGKFKHPFGVIHSYCFYLLAFMAFLHIVAVIVTEKREGGSLISAMFTGKKLLKHTPVDDERS